MIFSVSPPVQSTMQSSTLVQYTSPVHYDNSTHRWHRTEG